MPTTWAEQGQLQASSCHCFCLMLNSASSHAQELSSFALALRDSVRATIAALLPPPEGLGTMGLCSCVCVMYSILQETVCYRFLTMQQGRFLHARRHA